MWRRCEIDNLGNALKLLDCDLCKPYDSISPNENVRDNAQATRQARTNPPRIPSLLGRDTTLAPKKDTSTESVACAVNPKAAPLVNANSLIDLSQRIRIQERVAVLRPELTEIGQTENNVEPAEGNQARVPVTGFGSRCPPDYCSNC